MLTVILLTSFSVSWLHSIKWWQSQCFVIPGQNSAADADQWANVTLYFNMQITLEFWWHNFLSELINHEWKIHQKIKHLIHKGNLYLPAYRFLLLTAYVYLEILCTKGRELKVPTTSTARLDKPHIIIYSPEEINSKLVVLNLTQQPRPTT